VLYTYVGGVAWDAMELHLADGTFAGVFPTNGGEACVWLMRPTDLAAPLLGAGSDRLDAWLAALDDSVPGLASRVRGGTITAPLRGAVGLPNHLRQATGPGWALVGDAGYHRDPITSHGITDAFRDAELLADAFDAGDLATYERDRDAAVAETFRLTRELGAFPGPARFVELQTELSRALDAEAADLAALGQPRTRQEQLHELHR
jgi:flavin-dependent dehydrogenase